MGFTSLAQLSAELKKCSVVMTELLYPKCSSLPSVQPEKKALTTVFLPLHIHVITVPLIFLTK